MAKVKKSNIELDDTGADFYSAQWVTKEIPIEHLEHHPDNFDLVGHAEEAVKNRLKESIKENGIQEPLAVFFDRDDWWKKNKLFVISGNERLEIARELKIKSVNCIRKDFSDKTEVLRFIWSVNKHRKQPKLPSGELLKTLFPEEKYPLLWADLRGKPKVEISTPVYSEFKLTGGKLTIKEEQKRERKEASQLIGITPKTLEKEISKAREKKKSKPKSGKKQNKKIQGEYSPLIEKAIGKNGDKKALAELIQAVIDGNGEAILKEVMK